MDVLTGPNLCVGIVLWYIPETGIYQTVLIKR